MDELRKLLASPTWWISVVIAGIIVNWLAVYSKAKLDEGIMQVSTLWRGSYRAERDLQRAFVDMLKRSPHQQIMAAMQDLRHRTRAIFFLVFGIFFASVLHYPQLVILPYYLKIAAHVGAAFLLLLSFLSFQRAQRILMALHEAAENDTANSAP